jgi:hypothetical protein
LIVIAHPIIAALIEVRNKEFINSNDFLAKGKINNNCIPYASNEMHLVYGC